MEASSLAQSKPKKPSQWFKGKEKVDSTTFQVVFGSKKRESWMGALMKMEDFSKELVHESKSKVGSCVGIYRTRFGMWFVYQGMSRIQGSMKASVHPF